MLFEIVIGINRSAATIKHASQIVLVAILDRFRIKLLAVQVEYEYIGDSGCLNSLAAVPLPNCSAPSQNEDTTRFSSVESQL